MVSQADLARPETDREPVVHGASAYVNHRCRCETCKAGNTARVADYRARRRARADRPDRTR